MAASSTWPNPPAPLRGALIYLKNKILLALAVLIYHKYKNSRAGGGQSVSSPHVDVQSPSSLVVESMYAPLGPQSCFGEQIRLVAVDDAGN